ncbi:AbgT family transporter [Streptosporangium lutulentum]
MLAAVITLVTKFVLSKRPDLDADPDADLEDIGQLNLSARERSALRFAALALVAALVVLVAVVLPESSPLRGEEGSIVQSPLLDGIAAVVALLFGLVGIVYGTRSGSIAKPGDVPKLMVEGIKQMAPVLVLFFAIAQFLAYFDWTHIGDVLAVNAAEALKQSGMPIVVVFLLILVVLTLVNIMVTSGSAMWALAAPVLVPMLMLVHVPAETTQALFRIADSGSTAITPMSPYFLMALGFLQRYRKSAGIGTLASYTLPLAIAMTVVWTLLFLAWWALGIPWDRVHRSTEPIPPRSPSGHDVPRHGRGPLRRRRHRAGRRPRSLRGADHHSGVVPSAAQGDAGDHDRPTPPGESARVLLQHVVN